MPLPNYMYEEIMQIYEDRQLENHNHLQERYKEVYKKFPRIREIDSAVSSISVKQAKKLIEGDKAALTTLKEQLNLLFLEKSKLLKTNGYPGDYLEMHYTCDDCKDTGYIGTTKCHCFKQREVKLLYSQSNLGDILDKENFKTFNLNFYSNKIDKKTGRSNRENAKIALETCKDFVDSFKNAEDNLLLYGDTGVGKTFLSHCIAKELIDKSYSVIYLTASELFDSLADAKFHNNNKAGSHIYDCDLLIIDDLGTELSNSFTSTEMFVITNDRLLKKKSTIISTNLSLEDLKEKYTERVFSRISSNYSLLRLTGEDIRIVKKLKI
ncbi:MAG: ATP-binding protein [Suipraeoptans sp.]